LQSGKIYIGPWASLIGQRMLDFRRCWAKKVNEDELGNLIGDLRFNLSAEVISLLQ